MHLNIKPIKILSIAALFAMFVGNSYVLTNYGAILNFLDVSASGAVFGRPSLIPGLDLEAYIYTPEFQILVNNGFERFNNTSPFREDLLSLYALPIKDWGLIFKPNLWAFFVVPPAYALSIFHFISIILFVSGYCRVANSFGATKFHAFVLSIGLFFTGFVQTWWMLFGAMLAIFPWILILIKDKVNSTFGLLVFYYVLTSFFISNFYPPIIITLGYVAGVIYITTEPSFFKNIKTLKIIIVALISLLTAVYYLWDPIAAVRNSVYPGNRIVTAGSDFPAILFLNQIFPTLLQVGKKSLINVEMAEAAAVTTIIGLVLIFFKDYKDFFSSENFENRSKLLKIALGLLLMWGWMLLPLPTWIGQLFFWERVQPRRMVVGTGIIIFIICSLLVDKYPWKINATRFLAFSLAIIMPWIMYKYNSDANLGWKLIDLAPIISCAAYFFAIRIKNKKINNIFFASLLFPNLIVFGSYNPIQSAKEIFEKHSGPAIDALDYIAKNSRNEIVALERFEGAVLNGLGYKSAGHALLSPQPNVYRPYFKEIDEENFNNIFNRTASVRVFYGIKPSSGGLGVDVPIENFGANLELRLFEKITSIKNINFEKNVGGRISRVSLDGNKILFEGMANWHGLNGRQALLVYTNADVKNAKLNYSVNPRGGAYMLSSFRLTFDMPEQWKGLGNFPLCFFSSDPKLGYYVLENQFNKVNCNEILKDQGG